MKKGLSALLLFSSFAIAGEATTIQITSTGYVVGGKALKSVMELDAEVGRLGLKEARIIGSPQVSYEQVRAVMEVMQRHHVFVGIVGSEKPE